MTTRRTLLIASALGAASASSVFAHSDETHAEKTAPAPKEQKPWGIAGDDKAVKRTVTFTMTDNMRFTPDKLAVKQGETVKLYGACWPWENGADYLEFQQGWLI